MPWGVACVCVCVYSYVVFATFFATTPPLSIEPNRILSKSRVRPEPGDLPPLDPVAYLIHLCTNDTLLLFLFFIFYASRESSSPWLVCFVFVLSENLTGVTYYYCICTIHIHTSQWTEFSMQGGGFPTKAGKVVSWGGFFPFPSRSPRKKEKKEKKKNRGHTEVTDTKKRVISRCLFQTTNSSSRYVIV